MNLYPRETVEFQPVVVEVNDVALTIADVADIELMVTASRERPSSTVSGVWEAPATLDGELGVMVDGPTLGPGTFLVWAKVTSSPETPVLEAGSFRVT